MAPGPAFISRCRPSGNKWFGGEAMNDLADYEIRQLQEDGEFAVSHLSRSGGFPSRLMVSPVLDRPALASFTKLEHAFTLRTDLDGSWAARPIELITFRGR